MKMVKLLSSVHINKSKEFKHTEIHCFPYWNLNYTNKLSSQISHVLCLQESISKISRNK